MGGNGAVRVVAKRGHQVLGGSANLTLGQRPDRHHVQSPGERLRGPRKCVVTGGASQDRRPGQGSFRVEPSLDRVEHAGRSLVLVQTRRGVLTDCEAGVGEHRVAHGVVVQVEHRNAPRRCESRQQS